MMRALTVDGTTTRAARRRGARGGARQMRLAEAEAMAGEPAGARRMVPFPGRSAPAALRAEALVTAAIGAVPALEALAITGHDLPDALLACGDVVLFQRNGEYTDGELCVVRLSGATRPTLRRVHADSGGLRLQPENRAYPAEALGTGEVVVEGRVVAIVRNRG